MKRIFDLTIAIASGLVTLPFLSVIWLAVRLTSPGPALHWSQRIGRNNKVFLMPKFRSMRIDTPQIATHLLADADRWITPVGRFLRKTSLDELPQLWSILRGDMSLVGPRPALFNQDDLVALRTACGVHHLTPGLTGWAQINGRDELPIALKVHLDDHYRQHQSSWFDMKIIMLTVAKVVRGDNVSQATPPASENPFQKQHAA